MKAITVRCSDRLAQLIAGTISAPVAATYGFDQFTMSLMVTASDCAYWCRIFFAALPTW